MTKRPISVYDGDAYAGYLAHCLLNFVSLASCVDDDVKETLKTWATDQRNDCRDDEVAERGMFDAALRLLG